MSTVITNTLRDRIRFTGGRIQLASTSVPELDDRNAAFSFMDTSLRPEVLTVANRLLFKMTAAMPHAGGTLQAPRIASVGRKGSEF